MAETYSLSLTDKTRSQLKEIEALNGSKYSATVRIAVDRYYNDIINAQAIQERQRLGRMFICKPQQKRRGKHENNSR